MKKCFFLLVACFLFSVTLQAQSSTQKTPTVIGEVRALAAHGDTVFVGGGFSGVYSYEKSSFGIALFDTVNGQHIPTKLDVSGKIKKIIGDESGTGFYIGGEFTSVGDSLRSGVAHLDANGKVTSRLRNWKIDNAVVNDIALRGDTLLVAGENLTKIYSKPINYLKGIDSGGISPNNSKLPEVNGIITAMVTDAFGARFICGDFTQVGNQKRNKLAKIDSNGNVLPWNPTIYFGQVNALQLNGSRIIVAGNFKLFNGLLRTSIAEIDTITGKTTTPLNIKVLKQGAQCSIYSLDKWMNNLVIGGDFNTVGDSLRQGAAVVDLTTGIVTARIINANIVYKVLVVGNQLYVAGDFTSVNGIARLKIASLNLNTMVLSSLGTATTVFSGPTIPRDMVVNGNSLYVAGVNQNRFFDAPALVTMNISADMVMNTFDVLPNESVTSIVLHNGMLYLSGNFSRISGNRRNGLAAINLTTNAVTPSFALEPFLREVKLLGASNNRLILSGITRGEYVEFNNNQLTTGIVAYHTSSDSLFAIPHQVIGSINTLLVSNDTLFVGGNFTMYGRNRGADSTRRNFAAISLLNYNVLAPKIIGNQGQYNSMVKLDSLIIIGGDLTNHPSGLLGLNLRNDSVYNYVRPNHAGKVNQMCLVNNQLYLAGVFTNGINSFGLISTSPLPAGNSTAWLTDVSMGWSIFHYQNRLYTFIATNDLNPLIQVRVYSIPSSNLSSPVHLSSRNQQASNSGIISSFAAAGNKVIATGDLPFIESYINARGLFAYLRSTGRVLTLSLSLNASGVVNSLAIFQNTLFVGGTFDSINAIARRRLGSINLTTCSVTTWNPSVTGTTAFINKLHIVDSNLFVGGRFAGILGQSRSSLCMISLPALILNSWNPLLNPGGGSALVTDIVSNSRSVFFSGSFSSVHQKSARNIFSARRRTLVHDSLWNPGSSNNDLWSSTTIFSIVVTNDNIYLLGDHSNKSGITLFKINTLTGQIPPEWSLAVFSSSSSSSNTITPYKAGLIVAGFLVDTVQASMMQFNNVGTDILTALYYKDTILLGGGVTFPFFNPVNSNIYEFLPQIKSVRIDMPNRNICLGGSIATVKLISTDALDNTGDYYVRLNNTLLGVINLPSNPECSFTLPTSFASGDYGLEVVSQETEKGLSAAIKVRRKPSKAILTSQSPSLCTGQNLSIFFVDSSNQNRYTWLRNDTIIAGANQYRVNAITQPGNYKGTVQEPEIGCTDTSSIVIVSNIGPCQSPSIAARSLRFTNITLDSIRLSWVNGNGTRRIVLAKLDSAVNTQPTYGITYNPSSQFGLGDSLGFRNYVVYNGASNECSVQGLIPGRRYHFAVIEYNETGASISYQSGPYLIGSITMPATTYYNKATGNVNVLSTWGTNLDGTGTAPTNFAIPAFYNIRNGTSPTLSGSWQLDSNGSVISVGVGSSTPPLQFTIPSGMTVTCGNLNLNGNATFTVTGNLTTNFLGASDTSLVVYNGSSGQILPSGFVGRCYLQGGFKLMGGDFWVRDTLRLETNVLWNSSMPSDTFTLGTAVFPRGHLIRTNSANIGSPFNRWIVNATASGTSGLLPIGRSSSSIQLNIITPASGSWSILVRSHYIPGVAGNAGLPLTETGVTLNTTGSNGYWKVLNGENRLGLSYNLIITANNFIGVTQPSQTRLVNRQTGGNWQLFGLAPTISGTSTSFLLIKNNISTFGEFAVAGNLLVNPLPSELIYFDALKNQNHSVKLFWQTASETNSDYFEIQRSTDAKQFEPIGAVNAAGNSSVVRNYEFIDAKLQQEGTYYYRLRMIDKDGSEAHSQVVSVNMEMEQSVQVYPNPVKNILTIEGATGMIYIYSSTGLQMIPPTTKNQIDVSNFPQGVYFIQTGNAHLKFVKQ